MFVTVEFPALLASALREVDVVVAQLGHSDWALPTPCSSWSARDVLNHVVVTTTKFSLFASGSTDSPRNAREDLLGDQPLSAFRRCRRSSAEAWRSSDMQRACRLPFGTFTASEAAEINAFDATVHAWDLAQVVDAAYEPPPQLIRVAHRMALRLVTPQAVADGFYARGTHGGPMAGTPSWQDVLVLTGR